jgi:ferredoxin
MRYAQCVLEAPEVFDLGDDGPVRVRPDAPGSARDRAEVAADLCPMQALLVED